MIEKITPRIIGEVCVLDIFGRLSGCECTQALRKILKDHLDQGRRKFLLNLAQVSFVDAYGIGCLISGSVTVEEKGGILKLLSLPKRAIKDLQTTKLRTHFEVHDNEAAAIRSF